MQPWLQSSFRILLWPSKKHELIEFLMSVPTLLSCVPHSIIDIFIYQLHRPGTWRSFLTSSTSLPPRPNQSPILLILPINISSICLLLSFVVVVVLVIIAILSYLDYCSILVYLGASYKCNHICVLCLASFVQHYE